MYKIFFIIVVFFSFCFPQTIVENPGPENVLVVYKDIDISLPNDTLSQISKAIMNYYTNYRNIDTNINVVKLVLPKEVLYNGERVILTQNGEVIKRDAPCANYNGNGICDDLAWKYYEDYIATPIRNHLNNTVDPITGDTLFKQIRYIVLCKGIPHRIMAAHDYSASKHRNNVSLDALLCLINQKSPDKNLFDLFGTSYSKIDNPYFNVDPNYTMGYHFDSRYFQNSNDGWTLSYLVSRLDGLSFNDVKTMIDNSVQADTTENYTWFIDTDTRGIGLPIDLIHYI